MKKCFYPLPWPKFLLSSACGANIPHTCANYPGGGGGESASRTQARGLPRELQVHKQHVHTGGAGAAKLAKSMVSGSPDGEGLGGKVTSDAGRTACPQRIVKPPAATSSVGLYTSIAFCNPIQSSIDSKTCHGPGALFYNFGQLLTPPNHICNTIVLMIGSGRESEAGR